MTFLPNGTVTFLFTDIEGSTPIWEQLPNEMRAAVALHLQLLNTAIISSGGVIFKIIGDAVQAAFPLATQAVAAAIAGQTSLHSTQWSAQTGPLKVRMGLHTGSAEIEHSSDRDDYAISHTLNRVARVMSAGHGGQILLSQETADLVERDLPVDVTLKDMGEHQLKGLRRLEHLFQVCAPGLPVEFPPLSSSISYPNNLPLQLTSFIGRETELRTLHELLNNHSTRLITLTGPGGTGKTRLAIQFAGSLLNSFEDGIWLIELASLTDPDLVPVAVAATLGLHEIPGKPIIQTLFEYLRNKRTLLILDNCEHVIDEATSLAAKLLQDCPKLQIMATSREILGVLGETPFRVPSLALPESQGETLEELNHCESIRLFIDRARAGLPVFQLTEANASAVTRICKRLDGIPLAIELAAARIRALSVEQIATYLDDSFRLLTGGSRNVLSRHQTLRALIDWSYNLLTPQEKELFLRLSVFASSFTLEAVELVCADNEEQVSPRSPEPKLADVMLEPETILDLVFQLVDKSLVIPNEGWEDTETHYRMLETIRQYARDKLYDSGKGASIRDQHLAYYLLLAEEAEPYLRSSDQIIWLDRIDAELDNLRLALEWSLATRVDEGLRLASALLWFWHIRGYGLEGLEWLTNLLAKGESLAFVDLSPNQRLIRAHALAVAGFLAMYQKDSSQTIPLLEKSVEILRGIESIGKRWLGIALLFLSKSYHERDKRVLLIEDALPLLQESGDPLYLAEYMMDKGGLLTEENKIEEATATFLECLALREESQDIDGIGTIAMSLGDMALFRRDFDECKIQYEKSLACYQAVKNKPMISILFSRLGNIDMLTGDFAQAAERFAARIAVNQQAGDRPGMINGLFDLGRLDLNLGEYQRASRRFADLTRIAQEIGSRSAILVGLTFQGLSALVDEDDEAARKLTRQVVDLWRNRGNETFHPGFVAGFMENLAVLLAHDRSDLAAQLFTSVDQTAQISRESNTAMEIAMYKNMRSEVRKVLGEEKFLKIQEECKKITPLEVLTLVIKKLNTPVSPGQFPAPRH